MEEKIYWIWLSRINALNPLKMKKLLDIYKNPKEIWNKSKEELLKIEGINEKLANEIVNVKYKKDLEKYLNYMGKNNIKIITYYDKDYPKNLRNIYDSPYVLYVKGNEKILNDFSLAIIGCRQNSTYGALVAKNIAKELALRKITTISGLAYGIDSISQRQTVLNKGKTIAVLGNGLDMIYPKENETLAEEIIKNNGAIVSEYVIGTKPLKYHFPARNRIISGISDGVIVVEAKKKSGTMITVDFALEQGKDIFAFPGNITSINSEGTNELIKQGAKIITNIEDVLEEYNFR